MKKRHAVMVGAAVAVLVLAGGLFASNMGFKLNYPLAALGGSSLSGNNKLALPYNQQTNLVTSGDLAGDIGGLAPGGPVISISRFASTSDALVTYTGSVATNFNLAPGEGYLVQVGADVDYIVVGSHDPGLAIALNASGTLGSLSGNNDFAPPYHTTASTAGDLRAELNAALGLPAEDSTAVLSISRFDPTADALFTYTGSVATNFDVNPGESYLIQMAQDVNLNPAHF